MNKTNYKNPETISVIKQYDMEGGWKEEFF